MFQDVEWTPEPTDLILWLLCAMVVVGLVVKSWPFLKKFVNSVDLIAALPGKLDAIGVRFDEQDDLLDEVRRMVTENHHENADPTLPDRISDVHHAVQESERRAQLRWDEHLAYSATIVERVSALEHRLTQMGSLPDDN